MNHIRRLVSSLHERKEKSNKKKYIKSLEQIGFLRWKKWILFELSDNS